MRATLALLADHASSTDDGKLNIMGIFNSFRAEEVPTTFVSMWLVFRLVGDTPGTAKQHDMALRCRAPTGREVFRVDGKLDVTDNSRPLNVQQVLRLDNLQIEDYGLHLFEVLFDEVPVAEIPLDVVAP